MKHHPRRAGILTRTLEPGPGTALGGQFDWGDLLPNGNGGAQRSPQPGRQSGRERKRRRGPDCEPDGASRGESRG